MERIRAAGLDVARDPAGGARQARRPGQQDRLPRPAGATTARSPSRATTSRATPRAALAFEFHRQLAKIGKPVDRGEWQMTPPTVNAYYDPQLNDINFPAGVLQPPAFDLQSDDAPNYGDTGGHDRSRADPRLRRRGAAVRRPGQPPTTADARPTRSAYVRARRPASRTSIRSTPIVDSISRSTASSRWARTSRISAALILAHLAWPRGDQGQRPSKPLDGLTPEQRFFVGYSPELAAPTSTTSASACGRPTDPHSPD